MTSQQIPVDRYAAPQVPTAAHTDPRIALYGLPNDEYAPEMIEAIENLIVPAPGEVFQFAGYAAPPALRNGQATAALIFAVLSIPFVFLWPVALVLGVMGMVKSFSVRKVGFHQSLAALVVCAVVLAVWVLGFSILYWTPSLFS